MIIRVIRSDFASFTVTSFSYRYFYIFFNFLSKLATIFAAVNAVWRRDSFVA